MIPINGFFEYGIMAILGGVGMVGMTIWVLSSKQMNMNEEVINEPKHQTTESPAYPMRKAA